MSVRWLNKRMFTSREAEQIVFVRSAYQQCFGTDQFPIEFMYDEQKKEPSYNPQRANFQKSFWLEKLGKGPLKHFSDQILGLVCAFQLRRQERSNPFKSGYFNDPVNLCCEELKGWLVNTLSKVETWTAGEHGNMRQVQQRIKFLNMTERSKMFPNEENVEMSLISLIVEVRMVLEDKVVPKIVAEIANHSAREHLRVLIANATDVLTYGCQVLVSIFRGANIVDQCYSLGSLIEPCRKEFDGILATESGRLLQVLESSPVFSEIFFLKSNHSHTPLSDGRFSRTYVANPFLGVSSIPRSELIDAGAASTPGLTTDSPAEGGAASPASSLVQIKSPAPSRRLSLFGGSTPPFQGWGQEGSRYGNLRAIPGSPEEILKSLQTQRSGIEPIFRKKPEVLQEFLETHGWLYEIATLIVVFEQSRKLAGVGGNLLVYGLANKTLNNMLDFMETILRRVKTSIEKLFEVGNMEKLALLRQNGGRVTWVLNFTYASSYKDGLIKSVEGCVEASSEVRVQANKVSPGGRLEKAKKETENFLELAQGILCHQAGLLDIPGYEPPKLEPAKIEEEASLIPVTKPKPLLLDEGEGSGSNPRSAQVAKTTREAKTNKQGTEGSGGESPPHPEDGAQKMEWFLNLMSQGDLHQGGSSYALEEDELRQLQEASENESQFTQSAGALAAGADGRPRDKIALKRESRLRGLIKKMGRPRRSGGELKRSLSSSSVSSVSSVSSTMSLPASMQRKKVSWQEDNKTPKPVAKASTPKAPVTSRFGKGKKDKMPGEGGDLMEQSQVLEEIARRKREQLIQEKLKLTMNPDGFQSSYALTEQERAFIEVDITEKMQLRKAHQEEMRRSSKEQAQAPIEERLLQERFSKFSQRHSQSPYENVSSYNPSGSQDPEIPEKDGSNFCFSYSSGVFGAKKNKQTKPCFP